MAGDWMKIELGLPDKPEVHRIAGIMSLDPDAVVGKLVRVWEWFNKHTVDGNAHGVTYSLLDRVSGVTGFGEAMMLSGWMEQNDMTLTMPKFDRHTSESSKARALSASRTLKSRNKCNAPTVTKTLHDRQQEKRREEVNIKTPQAVSFPQDFSITEELRSWAASKGFTRLEDRLEHFRGYALANGKKYKDWTQAFRNAVRDDWAKLGSAEVAEVVL